jgi:hypothetical protein
MGSDVARRIVARGVDGPPPRRKAIARPTSGFAARRPTALNPHPNARHNPRLFDSPPWTLEDRRLA